MFWLGRLKTEDGDSTWAVPFADMLSLLLAVFVMIAAMGELRPGKRFDLVSGSVRSAFGFGAGTVEALSPAAAPRPLTIAERLQQAGLHRARRGNDPAGDDALKSCEVITQPDRIIIRLPGRDSFAPLSAQLRPPAMSAVSRLAVFLTGGQAQLEIRGHSGEGTVPSQSPLGDGLDLSYQRGRAVADVLVRAGVTPQRLHIAAWGDNQPLHGQAGGVAGEGANRRIEIIVHTVPAKNIPSIAEKEQSNHG